MDKAEFTCNNVTIGQTCQPNDSTETSDSDDSCDDDLVREALLRHEEKRLRLMAEKNRLMEEERKRLEMTKREQDMMINQIKSIFSSSEPTGSDKDIQYCGYQRVGGSGGSAGVVRPPQAVIQPYRPRYATNMPRRPINTVVTIVPDARDAPTEIVTLDDSDAENSNDTSGIVLNLEEDEPKESLLKIGKVFSGDEASKLDNDNSNDPQPFTNPADVVFDSKEHSSDDNDSDDDSDIEIIDMPVNNKKAKVLQDILKELQEDPKS